MTLEQLRRFSPFVFRLSLKSIEGFGSHRHSMEGSRPCRNFRVVLLARNLHQTDKFLSTKRWVTGVRLEAKRVDHPPAHGAGVRCHRALEEEIMALEEAMVCWKTRGAWAVVGLNPTRPVLVGGPSPSSVHRSIH